MQNVHQAYLLFQYAFNVLSGLLFYHCFFFLTTYISLVYGKTK